MDQNHVAKIGSYNIPILAEAMRSEQGGAGNRLQADRYVVGMAVFTLSSSRFQSID